MFEPLGSISCSDQQRAGEVTKISSEIELALQRQEAALGP